MYDRFVPVDATYTRIRVVIILYRVSTTSCHRGGESISKTAIGCNLLLPVVEGCRNNDFKYSKYGSKKRGVFDAAVLPHPKEYRSAARFLKILLCNQF